MLALLGLLCCADLCWAGLGRTEPAAAAGAAGARGAQGAAEHEQALIRKGIDLRKADDDRGAREAFAQAWQRTGSPEALAQLALAEQALGDWARAHEHLRAALEQADHLWIAAHRATLQASLGEMESRLGKLEVSCNVAAAEIRLDGRSIGKTPLVQPLLLLAGRSVIQVSKPGYFDVTRQVQIDAHALSRLEVTLIEKGLDPGRLAPAHGGAGARQWLEYGSLGLAALGVSVGVTGYVLREINVRQYNDDSRCNTQAGVSRSDECAGPAAAWRLGETLAIAGFAGAGVFGGLGLYLWLDTTSTDRVTLACGIGLQGIDCSGSF